MFDTKFDTSLFVREKRKFDTSKVEIAEKSQVFKVDDVVANLDTTTHSSTVNTRLPSR